MRLLKPIVPPLLWGIGKNAKRRLLRSVDHYACAPDGWQTPLGNGDGNEAYWISFVAREKELCARLIARVCGGNALLTESEGESMKFATFGYVLALASRRQSGLSVLDYGGNLGEYSWVGKALLPDVELEYHCKELPAIASAGRALSPGVHWHIDDGCLDATYDVVMFSASLPYLPDWKRVLDRAVRATRGHLWLSDIPAVRDVPTYVITQRTGGITHLQSVFNRSEVVGAVEAAGLRLLREFVLGEHPPVANAPEQPISMGWLFAR